VLCDGDNDRLMVSSGIDRADLIEARRKTAGNISGELSIGSSIVQALEESKLGGVGDGSLVKGGKFLDNDVRVALDLTLGVKKLGS